MELLEKIKGKKVKIGIIGLGYVGLPLGLEFAGKGFDVLGFDLDDRKIEFLKEGKSYIKQAEKNLSQKFGSMIISGGLFFPLHQVLIYTN